MKILDCFMFFNELDLLEIRLQELDSVIDQFVLCESRYCHNGSPKPLYYADNKSRFTDFNKKIVHIVADDIVINGNVGKSEANQRNAIQRGVRGARIDDIILMGDLDEIPRAQDVNKLRTGLLPSTDHSICFIMNVYYYFLNYQMHSSGWSGTVACMPLKYPDFQSIRKTRMYTTEDPLRIRIENAGWHFSYVSPIEEIVLKLNVSADTVGQTYTREWIEDVVKNGGDIRCKTRSTPKSFVPQPYSVLPLFVQKNIEKFKHLLTAEPPNENIIKLF